MGAFREVAEAGGCGSNHIRKVLLGGGTGGATLWNRNIGAVSSDAYKYRGVTHGFPMTGDGDEDAKARGRDLDKGGTGHGASGGKN